MTDGAGVITSPSYQRKGRGFIAWMKKAAQVEKLEQESAVLMQKIREETDIKKKENSLQKERKNRGR